MVAKTKNNVNAVQDVVDQDRTCCICASEIKVWAIGKCEHPVCYICSSRMRVLNAKEEKVSKLCAICKTEMEFVIFHTSMFRFEAINIASLDRDEASGICFFNSDSRDKFEDLLKETGPILTKGKTFVAENFEELKLHMRRKHDLHHCEICKAHYLLFPRERKWYSRKDLATHKLKGDQDDKSHKGHPQCKFCKERFLDKDELYRHLMTVHHNCHICEAKTGEKEFFDTMNDLIKHFRKDHFFCEHPDCIDNPLTSVFANETDFKLHVANKHGGIDKRDIRIDVGLSRNAATNAIDDQRALENEFEERRNQIAPDMENEEDFPTMGGKKKSGFTFHAAKSGLPQSNSMSSRVSQGTNRNVAHQNYRSLGANKNISNAEEFPTLGGGNAPAPVNPNWKAKAIQNNKPITRPNVIASTASKKKSKAAPAPKVAIPSQNSATAALYAASQGQSWSQEPDVFVEKTQLQLEAERKAQLAEERASQARKSSAPQRDHSQFPSLGGGGPKPAAFWGVPGASIPKSNQGKKKSKQKVLARPDILPGQAARTVAHKPSPAKSKAQAQTAPAPPQAQHVKKNQKRVESDVKRGEANSASDIAARAGGGYSGWSAPPDTFVQKSLIEIEEERKRTTPKVKNQKAPKIEEFPTLGGSKAAASAGFWGVPGAATKKTPGSGKGKGSKRQPISMPAKQPAVQLPAKKQTAQLNGSHRAKKSVIYSAPEPVPESQNASQIAQRMTGGYSGWSAPPTVFVEKSLLEIQEERQNKLANAKSQNQSVNWSPKDESEFPSFGGDFASSVPAVSGFSSALAKQQKQVNKKAEKAEKARVEPVFEASSEHEFPAFENNHQICDNGVAESSEESDSEVDMAAVNQRLRDAISNMSAKLQDRFKISSGKFRTGQISADDYVKEGSSIMGKKAFAKLIPDLLATLPDGKHKNALAAANRQL